MEFSVLPPWTDHAYNMTGTLNRRRPMYRRRCNSDFVTFQVCFTQLKIHVHLNNNPISLDSIKLCNNQINYS